MTAHWDVIIIGAGTAGLAALREVSKETDKVLMINAGAYGTTCARVGCMPSKVLIESARALNDCNKLQGFGIRGGQHVAADIPAMLQHVRKLRDHFVSGTLKATDNLGKRSISGLARLVGPQTVEVEGQMHHAERIILATGSRPVMPESWKALGDRVLTTDTFFEQVSLPQRMAVIGLGPIGLEMAQAMAYLGIEVHAFDRNASLAGISDPEVNKTLRAALEKDFSLHTGEAVALHSDGDGVRVEAGEFSVVVDRVLVAVGRQPNIDSLNLASLGVPLDDHGMPPFDATTTQIGDLPVYIAGDVNHHAPILHEAADEGYIAAHNAMAEKPTAFPRRTPMGMVFIEPGVAFVGQRFAELDADAIIGEASFAHQGRAVAAQRNQGLMRVYASGKDAVLVGAEMCVPAAEHMAHLLALAISEKLTVQQVLRMPFYHPVLEEGLRSAFRAIAKQVPCNDADLAKCGEFKIQALD
jgi:dihydrolipoamide dehydrogenase